jgi:hypothetical protein
MNTHFHSGSQLRMVFGPRSLCQKIRTLGCTTQRFHVGINLIFHPFVFAISFKLTLSPSSMRWFQASKREQPQPKHAPC